MKFQTVSSMLLLALFALAGSAKAEEKGTSPNSKRLEVLKSLAGDWVEIGKDGKPTDKLVSSIRVTSGGNTVQETLFPGSDHEMVTMYHLDGEDLVLTHYCMLGNQPRMRAEPGKDGEKIVFKFVSATNLKSSTEHHMDQATLKIDGKDRFEAVWTSTKDGAPCHEVTLELARKQK